MKTKIKSIIVAASAAIAGYVISYPLVFHICSNIYKFNDYTGCLDSSIKNIGSPLLIFSLGTLFIVVAVSFFSEKIFHSWLKLALWMIPLSFIFIATTDITSHRMGIELFPFYRDDAARLAAEIFGTVSLALVIWKIFAIRRSAK